MKKKMLAVVAVLVVASASFIGGWILSDGTSNNKIEKEFTEKPQEIVASSPTPERYVDIASGTGMDPSELYAELLESSGKEFDSQYIAYVILMQNTLTGMNRLAKENAEHPDLKAKANELWSDDAQVTTELYALQRTLGYTHH